MVITYLGGECVKMQFGDMVIAFNPPAKDSALKSPRFGADIAGKRQRNLKAGALTRLANDFDFSPIILQHMPCLSHAKPVAFPFGGAPKLKKF